VLTETPDGKRYVKASKNEKGTTKILEESAARKGILREDFKSEQEFRAAAKKALTPATADEELAATIADGIVSGAQPPDLKGLYRHGAQIRKALQDRGYSLTDAQQDWEAVKKNISSANSPQQLKIRQSIDNTYHSLDVIEDYAKQWDAGGYPLLNKARLAAARNGALGPDAQKIAVALESQIADVTSELGNVYMGGNSPTDHSLALAAKNLQADWSKDTLLDALKRTRVNLTIRDNSLKHATTLSPDNKYAKPETAATPPSDVPTPKTPAEYNALKSGTPYFNIHANKILVKP
jgi:hypothetical protein